MRLLAERGAVGVRPPGDHVGHPSRHTQASGDEARRLVVREGVELPDVHFLTLGRVRPPAARNRGATAGVRPAGGLASGRSWPAAISRRNASTAVGSVGKTRSSPIRSSRPEGSSASRRSCLTRASATTTPRLSSSLRSSSRASAAVRSTSDDRLGVEHEPPDGYGGRVDGGEGPAGEVLGVGEEQRRVVAVDEQAGHLGGVGVVVDVVHPGQSRHVALDGVVRPGHPAQQVEHRDADRDQHALEHPDDDHAERGDDRDQELAAPERRDPAELADVDEPHRGVHHDRAERRRGERREGRPEQQHRDRGRHRGDQPGRAGPAAGGVADRGPAAGAADRHPGEEGGAEVGAAEGDQLPAARRSGRPAGWRTRARSGCCRRTPRTPPPARRGPGRRPRRDRGRAVPAGAARTGCARSRRPRGPAGRGRRRPRWPRPCRAARPVPAASATTRAASRRA